MDDIKRHYESMLAEHYSWFMGGFEENAARSEALFDELDIAPRLSDKAVDLGCGSGFQAIPLARRGFSVFGLDMSAQLLGEMAQRAEGLAVQAVEGDFRNCAQLLSTPVELATCMGDTLSHLKSHAEVETLMAQVYRGLEPGGRLLLTFRDQTAALGGPDRFLSLRSDESRIFTCFLEYGEDHLDVTDLLHLRQGDGWELISSQYRKVRLTAAQVEKYCRRAGFAVLESRMERGLVTLLAEK